MPDGVIGYGEYDGVRVGIIKTDGKIGTIFQMQIYNHKGEIYMLKKVKEILDKRSKINDEDDYRIEKCRDELIDALSQDELLTIDILNQLNEKEILYTSEVFEEIAYNLQSVNYINCLKYIEKKILL